MVFDARLFADDSSLFSVVHNEQVSADILNTDLKFTENGQASGKCSSIQTKISKPFKLFSHTEKANQFILPNLERNRSEIVTLDEHKHLGFFFDSRLSLLRHMKEIIIKARRGEGIIRSMSKYVSRDVLDQMHKLYVRPHLDYGDLIYHKDDSEVSLSLAKRIESVQYTAALTLTKSCKNSDKSKLLDELGCEHLHDRRRYRRLTHFFILPKEDAGEYMTASVPQPKHLN